MSEDDQSRVEMVKQLIGYHTQRTGEQPEKLMSELMNGLAQEEDMKNLARSFMQTAEPNLMSPEDQANYPTMHSMELLNREIHQHLGIPTNVP